GAWGTASTAHVSTEALIEADAVPVVKEKLTVRQWITRGALAACSLGIVVGIVVAVMHYKRQGLQDRALKDAVALADAKGDKALSAVDSAELHRALAEYYLRQDRVDEAQRQLKQARALAMELRSVPEHDAMLIRVALTQASMGGEGSAVTQKTRLSWNDTREEIKKTLLFLKLPDSRAQAMREVGGLLLDKKQGALVAPLAFDLTQASEERADLLAIVGLQLHARQQDDLAQTYAKRALPANQPKPGAKPAPKPGAKPPAKPASPPVAAALLTLLMALDQPDKAKELAPMPKPQDQVPAAVRTGYAGGLAWKDQWDAALALANNAATAPEQLDALAAVAEVAAQKQASGQATKAVEAAAALAKKDPAAQIASPWALVRLVRAGIAEKLGPEPLEAIVQAIADPGLRRDVHAEVLAASPGTDADAKQFAPSDQQKDWGPLWTERLARRLASAGKADDVVQELDRWQSSQRALGYVGVALGVQDLAGAK
ncbi:MAG TPA: hypothetical protein VFA18_17980, partial [Gemmataceae bacterium]|nr:hypothetical protein [Gemmataceae bacterium]